jgi:hypothetical protein
MKSKKARTLPVPTRRRDLVVKPADRWWLVTDSGQLVRGITWTNWEPCHYHGGHPREYTMRLAPDDPRPIGRRVCFGKYHTIEWTRHTAEWYLRTHPIGVWVEIGHPESREVPPYRNHTALWLAPVGKERAA